MKKTSILIISLIFISFVVLNFSCNKDNGSKGPDAEDYRPLYEMAQALNDLQNGMMDYSSQGYPLKAALVSAAQDLEDHASVTSTLHIDSSYVYVTMNSGLQAVYFLSPLNSDGNPMFRGVGGPAGGMLTKLIDNSENEITNKKILLFNAKFVTLYNALQVLNENKEKYGLEVTELNNKKCTYEIVTTFGDYGLVVLNTHGLPNGFMLGAKLPVAIQNAVSGLEAFAESITGSPSRNIADQILIDKQIGVAVGKYYDPDKPIHEQVFADADTIATYISAKQIAQFNFSNTIIMGNMCYSGFNNTTMLEATNLPILEGFRQASTRTYYGYQQTAGISHTVNSEFCESMELNLYRGFFNDNDSTGNVHKQENGNEYFDPGWVDNPTYSIKTFGDLYFRQFFADNYSYKELCVDSMVDKRDGTVYKTVCIGDQVWMAENLNYDTLNNWCYDNNPDNCNSLGKMYDWETALVACPEGWHLPSEDEFQELIDALGGQAVAGGKLKATTGWDPPNTGATNSSGFTGLSSGEGAEGLFGHIGRAAFYWSSTPDSSWVRLLYLSNVTEEARIMNRVQQAYDPVYSCRCVKDK